MTSFGSKLLPRFLRSSRTASNHTLVRGLVSQREAGRTLSMLLHSVSRSSTGLSTLLRTSTASFGRAQRWYSTEEEPVEQRDAAPEQSTGGRHFSPAFAYNKQMNALSKEQKYEEVEQVFKEMQESGVAPDRVSYNILMNSFIKRKDLESAVRAFNDMREKAVAADTVTYSTLIHAYTQAARHADAIAMYEEMVKEEVPRNIIVMTPVMRSAASMADADLILRLLHDLRDSNIPPTGSCFSQAIIGCCRARRVDLAYQILNEMDHLNIPVSMVTYGAMLNGLIRAGRYEDALSLFEQARDEKSTVVLDDHIMSSALDAALKSKNQEKAIELCDSMMMNKVTPNTFSMRSALFELARSEEFSLMKRLSKMWMSRLQEAHDAEPQPEEHSGARGGDRSVKRPRLPRFARTKKDASNAMTSLFTSQVDVFRKAADVAGCLQFMGEYPQFVQPEHVSKLIHTGQNAMENTNFNDMEQELQSRQQVVDSIVSGIYQISDKPPLNAKHIYSLLRLACVRQPSAAPIYCSIDHPRFIEFAHQMESEVPEVARLLKETQQIDHAPQPEQQPASTPAAEMSAETPQATSY